MLNKSYSGNKKLNTVVVFATCWFVWASLYVWVLNYFGIANFNAVTDAAVSYILLAAFCVFVINNLRYYLPKKEKYLYVLFMSFALGALWLAVINFVLKTIFRDDVLYLHFLQRTLVLRYVIAFLLLACNTLAGLLWFTQKDQQKENERRATTEKLARDAELNKLRQQLQPHFLFNSLNSISALTGQQPEKARHMIQQLSDFLRGTLRNEGQQWVTIKDEMEYLQLYLDIEKVRFGYRLQSKTACQQSALQLQLPSMLLQPLVENAIKFGLYDTLGEVEILISVTTSNNMLQVIVQNPYDEVTAMPLKGTGFGIASVRRRLFLLFGRQDLLQIKKNNSQFIVELNIPQVIQ